jgi:hypothetical protein
MLEIIYYQITIESKPKKEEQFSAYIITLLQLHKQMFYATGSWILKHRVTVSWSHYPFSTCNKPEPSDITMVQLYCLSKF